MSSPICVYNPRFSARRVHRPMPVPILQPIPLSLHAAMAFQFAVGGAFLPFVTLYLRDRGLGYEKVSWVHLTSAAVGSTVPFLWGWVADRWLSAEKLLALLHAGGAAALWAFARQSSFGGLLATYAVLFALYPPTGAILSATAYHNLASPDAQFGRLRLWGSIGWMLPSLPVYAWLALAGDTRTLDLAFTLDLAAALEVLATVVCLRLPHTPPAGWRHGGHDGGRHESVPYGAALRQLLSRRGFLTFLGVIFLVHSSFAVLFYYSPPALEAAGFEREWIGPLQCVGVAAEVPFLFALPWVIRRFGYHGTITMGCASLLLRQLAYASASPRWVLASSYVLAGACVAFYLTAVSLSLNAMADRSVRATAQTLFSLVGAGLGQMAGHRAVGWIASGPQGNLTAAFLFASATAAGALGLLVFGLRGKGLFSDARGGAGRAAC